MQDCRLATIDRRQYRETNEDRLMQTSRERKNQDYLKLPANRKGSCGMTAMLDRNVSTGTAVMSSPSMETTPSQISTIRSRLSRVDDFPDPVRPTMPTWMKKSKNLSYASIYGNNRPCSVENCAHSRQVHSMSSEQLDIGL